MFASVRPTDAERAEARPGDALVAPADVVMDRAFTLAAASSDVWPWLLQLGKRRAGWYLPRSVERFVPAGRRAARTLHPQWQQLRVGDVVPDYSGRDETLEVAELSPEAFLVFTSQRRSVRFSWSITLRPLTAAGRPPQTRLLLRVRLAPVRRTWLANSAGDLLDLLTIAGLAAGLRERVEAQQA